METGATHPAAALTDLTCPLDTDLQPANLLNPTPTPAPPSALPSSALFHLSRRSPSSSLSFPLPSRLPVTARALTFHFPLLLAGEQAGIGGLVKTNRRPCGSPRVAARHNKPPAPCRRRQRVRGAGPTAASGVLVSMTIKQQHRRVKRGATAADARDHLVGPFDARETEPEGEPG